MSALTEQGTARRVPVADDANGWSCFRVWISRDGEPDHNTVTGELALTTADGRQVARPGDWVIRTIGKQMHIAGGGARA